MRCKCNSTHHERMTHLSETAHFQAPAMIREFTQPTDVCLVKIDHFRKRSHGRDGFQIDYEIEQTRKRACALTQFRCLQKILLWAESLLDSERLRTFRRHQHFQESGSIANGSGDCYEWFGQWRMFLRQCFKTGTDCVEVIDFAQDRLKRHGHIALSLKHLRWENFRWTGLGQKT